MVEARGSHGNAYVVFTSLEGWWTLAGGNTPGSNPFILHPEGVLESTVGCPIRLIGPICPIPPRTKSTVDLKCEPLIRVDNGLIHPFHGHVTNQQSGLKIRESNQNQTVTNQNFLSLAVVMVVVRKVALTQSENPCVFAR